MTDKVRILFLASDSADGASRLRLDKEFREIGEKINIGTMRDRLQLLSEWAVKIGDLQQALLRHQPDIVHFTGRGCRNRGIVLADNAGNNKAIDRHAFAELFSVLKDNIRIVVLNGCYAKRQVAGLAETIDFTVGVNGGISDEAAIVFAAYFYQGLAFGRTVREAFDLAVIQLEIEGLRAGARPALVARDGVADCSIFPPQNETAPSSKTKSKLNSEEIASLLQRFILNTASPDEILALRTAFLTGEITIAGSTGNTAVANGQGNVVVGGDAKGAVVIAGDLNMQLSAAEYERLREALRPDRTTHSASWKTRIQPMARFLPLGAAPAAFGLLTDVSRRWLGDDGDSMDLAGSILLWSLFAAAGVVFCFSLTSFLSPELPFARRVAGLAVIAKTYKSKPAAVLIMIGLTTGLALEFSLPIFARSYLQQGIRFQDSEYPDLIRAVESYQRALRLSPSCADAHARLGTIYEETQPERAIEEYLLALKWNSRLFKPKQGLARLCTDKGNHMENPSEALEWYDRALDWNPKYPDAYYHRAVAYENLGQRDKAKEDYNATITCDGQFYAAYNNLARLHLVDGQAKEAESLLRKARRQPPDDNRVLYALNKNSGWANLTLATNGKTELLAVAERYLRSAISLQKENPSAHCLLAKVLAAQKRMAEATAEFCDCLRYEKKEEGIEPGWLSEANAFLDGPGRGKGCE
jgi:tetratricopeptide (TPR) repeat protein